MTRQSERVTSDAVCMHTYDNAFFVLVSLLFRKLFVELKA